MKQAHQTAHPSHSYWSLSFCVAKLFHDAPSSWSTYKLCGFDWTMSMSLNHQTQREAGHARVCGSHIEYMNMNDSLFTHEKRGSEALMGRGLVDASLFKCVTTLSQVASTCWAPIPLNFLPYLTHRHKHTHIHFLSPGLLLSHLFLQSTCDIKSLLFSLHLFFLVCNLHHELKSFSY